MGLQRTRRPRISSGRSLRSLGSPLNARSLGHGKAHSIRILFLPLSLGLLAVGVVCVGLPLGVVIVSAIHRESILNGKDPVFIFLVPLIGVFVLRWARDSWRKPRRILIEALHATATYGQRVRTCLSGCSRPNPEVMPTAARTE